MVQARGVQSDLPLSLVTCKRQRPDNGFSATLSQLKQTLEPSERLLSLETRLEKVSQSLSDLQGISTGSVEKGASLVVSQGLRIRGFC